MADEATNRRSFRVQAGYCAAMDAPVTARIAAVLSDAITRDSEAGRRILDWPGEPVADALVLRLIGGLHFLHRAGVDPALSGVFTGATTDPGDVAAVLASTLSTHDNTLRRWLYGPPQTNEAGRSAGLMTGLLHLAARFGPRMDLLEIGSSAGLNLVMDRFAFNLGGVPAGPGGAALTIRPEWRGPPPPMADIAIESLRGVDIAPIDIADPAARARLAAYVWVEAAEREARLAQAIGLVRAHGIALDAGDAADWVEARLAEPQAAGVTRVLMHSVVWQYLPIDTQRRIRDAMARAGAAATLDRPIGWVMMEPNRDLNRHEVRVRGWPGNRPMELVALTHAHGAWVEALSPPYAANAYVMGGVAPE